VNKGQAPLHLEPLPKQNTPIDGVTPNRHSFSFSVRKFLLSQCWTTLPHMKCTFTSDAHLNQSFTAFWQHAVPNLCPSPLRSAFQHILVHFDAKI
jgi:hypothetical protein